MKINATLVGYYPESENSSMTGPMRVFYNISKELKKSINLSIPHKENETRLGIILDLLTTKSDVFNLHGIGYFTLIGFLIAKIRGVPVVYTAHGLIDKEKEMGYDYSKVQQVIEYIFLSQSESVIYVSKKLRELSNIENNKSYVIPNAPDPNFFINNKKENSYEQFTILYAGGARFVKGLDFLIDTLTNINISYRLNIAGTKSDQIFSRYKSLEKISENTEFLGYLDHANLKKAYCKSDILVHPSRYEPFGLVPVEAMACKLPVIVSDKVGMSYLLSSGNNGFIVQFGDQEELMNVIRLLYSNKKIRNEVASRGFETIQKVTWENIAHKYVNVFERILD